MKPLRTTLLGSAALLFFLSINSYAVAPTEVVNDFGEFGWYSWDTRNSSGTALNGPNDTSPDINSTLLGRSVGGATTADDTSIEQQIIFMGEGMVVNDAGDAAGNPPPASPLGSLGGLGYVRLDATGSNSGKADISFINAAGIAAASALIDPNFDVSYRYFIQPQNVSRTIGLNIALTNSSQSNLFIFAFVDPAAVAGWNTSTANDSTSLFTLFQGGVGAAEGGVAKTLTDWSNDPTFGPQIFGGTESIFRIGFNQGSGQRDNLTYLDWMQSNLLNSGNVIDFQAVPEPSTWVAGFLTAIAIAWSTLRRRKIATSS
jgi:hypothetical protein